MTAKSKSRAISVVLATTETDLEQRFGAMGTSESALDAPRILFFSLTRPRSGATNHEAY
jgi:hypothetical protein